MDEQEFTDLVRAAIEQGPTELKELRVAILPRSQTEVPRVGARPVKLLWEPLLQDLSAPGPGGLGRALWLQTARWMAKRRLKLPRKGILLALAVPTAGAGLEIALADTEGG